MDGVAASPILQIASFFFFSHVAWLCPGTLQYLQMVVRDFFGFWATELPKTWPIPEESAGRYRRVGTIKIGNP
jgi:hypothetical protein